MRFASIAARALSMGIQAWIGITFIPGTYAQPAPPAGGGTSASVVYNATYKLDGGSANQSNQTYTATASDTSGVWVTNSGVLGLLNPTINTSGNASSQDNSSFYGLNAGLLATAAGKAQVTGGSITTTGTGANGAFATGAGSSLTLTGVTINAAADGGHAAMATQGGTLTLTSVNMTTTGASSSAVATDRGGGTIVVTGGTVKTSGMNSAGIYSTGNIVATGTSFQSTGAEAAVIEGANSISLTGVSMTTTKEKWGVMIYQSMSGDVTGTRGVFTMTGGSLRYSATSGPLFYVNNSTGVITLTGVSATANSGLLVKAAAGDWGTSGSNGGTVILTTNGQVLSGNMVIDKISSLSFTGKNSSSLTGAINAEKMAGTADVTLDSTSKWIVTGDSYISTLQDASGISGLAVTNITGNGHNVYYEASLSGNAYLGGKVYSLVNGGSLLPSGSTSTNLPVISPSGVVNAASFVAGAAPGAWISIVGSNLATSTQTVTASDLVNGYLPTTFGGATVTVNGKPAFLQYVSPTQINAQAPSDSTTGSVAVTVTTTAGSSSQAVSLAEMMPGLFTESNYVLAVRASDSAVINGTGAAVAGYLTAAAARPGDTLSIYATGLGATTTAVPAGLVFSGAYPSVTMPAVTIGGATAEVLYSGLVGAGLYQINLVVPGKLAAGTHAVVVRQGTESSPSSAVMKIAAN